MPRRPRWWSRAHALRAALGRKPTWQPMLTIANPRKNGLASPIQTSSMYRPSVIDFQYTLDGTWSC